MLGKWNDWEPLPSFQVYGDITDKINYIFTWLTSDISIDYNADGNKRTGDCCNDGTLIEDGKEETEATVSVQISAHQLPTQYGRKFELGYEGKLWTATLKASAGLFATINTDLNVLAGERKNDCLDENCLYWSTNVNATFGLAVINQAETCLAAGIFKRCCSFSLPTIGLSTGLGGHLDYNKDNCDDGFDASVTIGPVEVYITGTVTPGDDTSCGQEENPENPFHWEIFPQTYLYQTGS